MLNKTYISAGSYKISFGGLTFFLQKKEEKKWVHQMD